MPAAKHLTRKLLSAVCEGVAAGVSLRRIAEAEGVDPAWLRQKVHADGQAFTQYARARDIGLDAMADELLEIADDGSGDSDSDSDADGKVDWENVNRSRLRVDTRKWYLAKMAPKRYSDKQTVEHEGGVNFQVVTGAPGTPNSREPAGGASAEGSGADGQG